MWPQCQNPIQGTHSEMPYSALETLCQWYSTR